MSNQNYQLPPIGDADQQKPSRLKRVVPVIIVLIILFGLLFLMQALKPSVDEKGNTQFIPAVEIINLKAQNFITPIKSDGLVIPKIKINISAEATGSIVYISADFTNGGSFEKGDVLLKIDPVDYELAITSAQANIASQQANLDLQQAKSDLAKKDWKKYGKKGKPDALNLNLPQVASAKAALSGARANLKLAQRNLAKTKIIAPFSGVVLRQDVDIGQFVNIGMSLANIASTTTAEIRISLSDEQLHMSGLSKFNGSTDINAEISNDDMKNITWSGKVSKVEAQRDAKTLFNFVVLELQKPFTQQKSALRFNSFVTVSLNGNILNDVYKIDRNIVLLENKINLFINQSPIESLVKQLTADDAAEYIYAKAKKFNLYYSLLNIRKIDFFNFQYPVLFMPRSQLDIKKINIVYSDSDFHYVDKGIHESDNIISTSLSGNSKIGDQLKIYSKYDEE